MNLLPIIFVLISYNGEVKNTLQLKEELEQSYNTKIEMYTDVLPKEAYYKPNNRYRADLILKYLSKKYPGKRVMALTSKDISITNGNIYDYGIFGLGSLNNNVCITSIYRLKSDNLYDRTSKVLIHELGHTYSIEHCTSNEPCVMKAGDHTAKGLDKESKELCSKCKKILLNNHG